MRGLEQEQERERELELFTCIHHLEYLYCTTRTPFFFIYKRMIQLLIVFNYLLSLPIVDYPFPHFRN